MVKTPATICLLCLLFAAGCTKSEPVGYLAYAENASSKDRAEGGRRYVAEGHRLVIETTEGDLPQVWASARKFCESIRCEIRASSINNKTDDSPLSASLSVRVAPDDFKKWLDHIGRAGSILQHTTQSEDKTAQVIDVEAKLKNLTEFRNRLRAMLGTRSAALKDVIEIERELSRVQAELDSMATRRKVLANETEKVAVEIEFRSKRSIASTGTLAPIARAWRAAGFVLAESIAALITFIVAVIPWLLLVVPACWFAVKFLRARFRKKTGSAESA